MSVRHRNLRPNSESWYWMVAPAPMAIGCGLRISKCSDAGVMRSRFAASAKNANTSHRLRRTSCSCSKWCFTIEERWATGNSYLVQGGDGVTVAVTFAGAGAYGRGHGGSAGVG